MRQTYPVFESIQPPHSYFDCLELLWHHRYCHRQAHQIINEFLLELFIGLLYLTSMDGARVKQNQVSSFTLKQHCFPSVRISMFQFYPITSTIFDPRVPVDYIILSSIIIGLRYHLQTTNAICTHIDQRNHALHTMKSTLMIRILIYMQVLNKGIPT